MVRDGARDGGVSDAQALTTPAGLLDPFPLYHRLRARAPVLWSELFDGAWLVTSHRLVTEALRDDRLSMERGMTPPVTYRREAAEDYKAFVRYAAHAMVLRDGAAHARLRGLVARAFTPRVAQAVRLAREEVAALLAPLRARGAADLAVELAAPLPARVIGRLMDLPEGDLPRLCALADELVLFMGGGPGAVRGAEAAQRATRELSAYFEDLLGARRRAPGEDLLSALVTVTRDGAGLSEREVGAQCLMLFAAGHQTTRDLLSAGVLALLSHPKELARLRARPSLLPAALEECLRYESPVQLAGRMATVDFELGGVRLRRGDTVVLVLGAANRDPAVFDEPDRFDVTRADNPHVAFGGGAHHCLGAALARAEAQAAFEALFLAPDVPPPRLAAAAVREPNPTFRRIVSLPIEWPR